MIKNERQYRITKAMAARFQNNLTGLKQKPDADDGVHPLIAKAQEEALTSQLADLENELLEYESLKAGKFRLDSLKVVADLPTVLIKARIAQGLSQKELAERIGLKEQQIQRYEATDYASANLARIQEVASAFNVDIDNPTTTTDSQ
jgi:ribosome-binding protein aMBF1 (putative translation factor)